jgi:hypothetical protein
VGGAEGQSQRFENVHFQDSVGGAEGAAVGQAGRTLSSSERSPKKAPFQICHKAPRSPRAQPRLGAEAGPVWDPGPQPRGGPGL